MPYRRGVPHQRAILLSRLIKSSRTLAALVLVICATPVGGQCPDGTPPPCAPKTAAAARRPAPALNPRGWIVVPFANVAKATDIDWLRDASVNLLSMDMGRWTDVNVVPDKRVADLVRELPPARRAEALSLNDGLAIAKRAGAGMLVMGDFLKSGTGVRIAANVFDVKSGAKLRSVAAQSQGADSLLTAFAPLARGVLAVPPPVDAKTGDVGTSNLAAYQAYLLGMKALFRYDLPEAKAQLTQALALDSTFALAHLQYSLLLWWGEPPGGAGDARRHALAAQRLGVTLPKRDRMLIEARVASASEEFARSCEVSRALVAQDSTDIQALYALGECSFHDGTIDPSPTDSGTGRFRNSWNTSIRALSRVLELDPSYLGAFEHIFDILQAGQRGGRTCPTPTSQAAECSRWYSIVLRAGDTLVTIPTRDGAGNKAFFAQQARAAKERPRIANLDLAEKLARKWLDSDRSSDGAHMALARVNIARGDLAAADAELKPLPPRASQENLQVLRARMEVAAKLGRGAEARAIFDSLVKAVPDNPTIDVVRGAMDLTFGRATRFTRGASAAGTRIGPEAEAYQRELALVIVGQPRPEMARAESTFFAASLRDPACNYTCRFNRILPSLLFSPHMPLGPMPGLDSARQGDGRLSSFVGLVNGDTALIRHGAVNMEQSARENISLYLPEFGWSIISAQGYLAVKDTASALRVVRFFVDTAMAFTPMSQNVVTGVVTIGASSLWPRAMLLRADLAMAKGLKGEARIWYLRVLDLWANADKELQPTIDRIKAALVKIDTRV